LIVPALTPDRSASSLILSMPLGAVAVMPRAR
jgi:hypothetical protein